MHGTPVSLSSSVGVPHRHPSSAIHRALAWLSAVLAALLLLTGSGLAGAQPPAPAGNSGNSVPANGMAYETLAKLLENEATRSQLIEQLRTLARQQETPPAAAAAPKESAAGKEPSLLSSLPGMGAASRLLGSLSGTESTDKPAAPPKATAPATPDTPQPSASETDPQRTLRHGEPADLPRQITSQTQLFLAGLAEGGATAVQTVQDMLKGNTRAVVRDHDWPSELSHLAIVALITLVSFLIFRRMATPVFHRMDLWVVRYVARSDNSQRVARLYSQTAAMVGALLVDLAAIVLAGTIGYGVALLFTGNQGELGNFERLFVNTFLAVEISRALIRVVFATRFKNLRLLPVPDETARYWNNWLERVASIAGYGVMLFVPIVGDVLTPEIAQVISLVLMLLVYGYAVRIIWKNRQNVREGIMARAKHSHSTAYGTLLRVIGRIWHVLAIAYFTLILVISQVNPLGAVSYVTYATLQTLLSIGIGALASAFLSAVLVRPFRLPDDVRAKLPQLEARLNSYVPAAVKWAKLIIASLVVLFVLDAWELFHAGEWITSEAGSQIVATVLRVSIVVLFAALVWTVVASIIEHRLSLDDPEQDGAPSARERTLLALFRNATLIVVVTMTMLIVLSQIGIDIGPLIAGAGVVGLAIGFGAQKLVQDVINGIFIQLENGMNQNDVVQIGNVFGTVEKITIRSVGIRTLDGGYHMIPFSSVDKFANHMRDFSYHLGEYTIAYRESVDDAAYYLERAFDELMTDPVLAPEVLEDMVIAGVTSLNERGFTLRIMIKTKPGMQWAVQRGFNRLVKKHFNAAGIELPYPHTVVYFGQDKNGDAPPIRVREVEARVEPGAPAMPAGHTPRPLTPADHRRAADVLGNELATVVDEEGNVSSQPGTSAPRTPDDEAGDGKEPGPGGGSRRNER